MEGVLQLGKKLWDVRAGLGNSAAMKEMSSLQRVLRLGGGLPAKPS